VQQVRKNVNLYFGIWRGNMGKIGLFFQSGFLVWSSSIHV